MGVWGEQVLPRLTDKLCGIAEMTKWRERAFAGLRGTVLEIGFGSGLNLRAYPREVERVLAVEPSMVARELARPRIEQSGIDVAFVGLEGESIPLDDDVADGGASAFTLCTIPGVDRALAEVRRVLKPGAPFHVLEHGLAPQEKVRTWQRRLDPLQQKMCGGCHLTRDAESLLSGAGFTVERVEHHWLRGPKPWSYLTIAVGRA